MQWLKDFINGFWETVLTFFTWLADTLLTLFIWLLNGFIEVFGWLFFTVFDGILVVVHGIFASLDLSALAFNTAASWSSMPPQLIWFINEIALPQCLTMVVGAVGIRMLLNLLPAAVTRI